MGGRAGIALAVACGAQFLIGIDGLAVAIALPAIQDDLGARPVDGQWVLTAYGLTFGGGLLLCARLGDLYGRRRMLVAGMALFGAASVAAGLARRWACERGHPAARRGRLRGHGRGASAIARRSPRALLAGAFATSALALLWLARAPSDAVYARDVLGPLVVLGASLPLAFIVLTQQALTEVAADERGMASGVFETANHLFGGAVGVAIYATVITAFGGYGPAFLLAAALAACGVGVARVAPASA